MSVNNVGGGEAMRVWLAKEKKSTRPAFDNRSILKRFFLARDLALKRMMQDIFHRVIL